MKCSLCLHINFLAVAVLAVYSVYNIVEEVLRNNKFLCNNSVKLITAKHTL